jgi:hypothetical protein
MFVIILAKHVMPYKITVLTVMENYICIITLVYRYVQIVFGLKPFIKIFLTPLIDARHAHRNA